MKALIISESITLLEALRKMYPDSSNRTLRTFLKNKKVLVDNDICNRANHLLEKNQKVSICTTAKKIPYGISIIYEDENIIIINKPEVLLSVPLDKKKAPNVLSILRKAYHTSGISAVHRIDKETSGVMIFAKNKPCKEILDKMFKAHDFTRIYLAIVLGNVKEDKGFWESRLIQIKDFEVRSTKNPNDGKIAKTHYSVIRRSKQFTFLKLTLETGRKHQIRVHCNDAGHTILGDKRYGSKSDDPISRICLHAYILEFLHPFTGKRMSFSAPIPPQFTKFGFTI